MKNEPVIILVGGVGTVVHAAVGLFLAFGVHLSTAQQASILTFVAVVTTLALAVLTRRKVYAPDSVLDLAEKAYKAGLAEAGVSLPPLPPDLAAV